MKVVKIKKKQSLKQLIKSLEKLDSEKHKLYFDNDFEINLDGYQFEFMGHDYLIDDVMYEDNEIPLLGAIRLDASKHFLLDDTVWEVDYNADHHACLTEEMGYYTKDENPYCLPSDFMSHTEWNFQPGGKYAWNVPGIPDHTLIGFYWIPLTSIIDILNKPEYKESMELDVSGADFMDSFENQFRSDDECYEKKGNHIIDKYKKASAEERKIYDDVLISLCGWSVKSICEKINELS